ncbi:MAG: NAD(P)H-dependent oxidoreductase [Azonexaceae bacterium]|nr:NAD(P)H-dependent oxidoreductase [Azonexaceae bacterium]
MNVLIVFAHPEARSLNAAMRDVCVEELQAQGHTVQVSDLYAMRFKPVVDRDDFPLLPAGERLKVAAASQAGYAAGALTDDVLAEIAKLQWADALILHFPLWWYTMPAILKGWVERVFAYGFAYGVGEHSDAKWGDRFGEGSLSGKRAMVITSTGGWQAHYSARGINGPLDDILFPINHNILYYPGAAVLPPFVVYRADRQQEADFPPIAEALRARMRGLFSDAPIAYRRQNGGDYEIPGCELKAGLARPGSGGFGLHVASGGSGEPLA